MKGLLVVCAGRLRPPVLTGPASPLTVPCSCSFGGKIVKVTGLLPGDCQRKSSFFAVHKAAICDNTAFILLLKSNEFPPPDLLLQMILEPVL